MLWYVPDSKPENDREDEDDNDGGIIKNSTRMFEEIKYAMQTRAENERMSITGKLVKPPWSEKQYSEENDSMQSKREVKMPEEPEKRYYEYAFQLW